MSANVANSCRIGVCPEKGVPTEPQNPSARGNTSAFNKAIEAKRQRLEQFYRRGIGGYLAGRTQPLAPRTTSSVGLGQPRPARPACPPDHAAASTPTPCGTNKHRNKPKAQPAAKKLRDKTHERPHVGKAIGDKRRQRGVSRRGHEVKQGARTKTPSKRQSAKSKSTHEPRHADGQAVTAGD